jgi:Na+/H+ antiporter NhaD/arsenite permease-like protein
MNVEPQPNPWMAAPFAVLLVTMALAPMACPDWWRRHYGKAALGLGAITLIYYLGVLQAPDPVLHTAVEYVSFISLIGALFVISGGIHIQVKGQATPAANVLFLLIGALVANVFGTTGASLLLIRPWLRTNKYRLTGHHVVFFIFIISNVGGALAPIADPPLFLGYLKGVPFWWVARGCWPMWLTAMGVLLVLFYVVDALNFRRAAATTRELETAHEAWGFTGLLNVCFLAVVIAAVFIRRPPFLREALMMLAATASYFTTPKSVHAANDFNFHPLREVAILFAGIFLTMLPALEWLQANAGRFGTPTPGLFFWGSGILSSALDNAPTYLSFLSAQIGPVAPPDAVAAVLAYVKTHGTNLVALTPSFPHADQIRAAVTSLQLHFSRQLADGDVTVQQVQMAMVLGNPFYAKCLQAISMGSVFFGANTYIGNGPNFMVKAIAHHQKASTPTFPGYIFKYTLPFMLPMLLLVWWLFFR